MNKTSPNCPTCAVSMVEGFIPDHAHGGGSLVAFWTQGAPEQAPLLGVKTDGRPRYELQAMRCPECGLVQLYATKRTYTQ